MKNPVLIPIIVVILLVAGFGAYFLTQNSSDQSDSMMEKADSSSNPEQAALLQKDPAMMVKDEGSTQNGDQMRDSRYVEYSKSALENASGNRRVLFFYASWCPTCRPADVDFKTNSSTLPSDVTVIRVNYNDPDTDQEEKDLAKQYGVTYQHTFVQIDEQGKQITKWNGGKIEELLANVKQP